MTKTLVIIPTYDERQTVPAITEALFAALPDTDVLFVDDNSPDGTGEVIDAMCREDPRVHVLHRPAKLGLGTAYIEGFRWALRREYDLVVEMDADGSHNPSALPHMLATARAGADVVIGSRYVQGGRTPTWQLTRRWLSRGASSYARAVLGLDVRDVTAGFVCWTRHALLAIDLNAVFANGYGFQIETKYRAVAAGLRLIEVPIVFDDRRVGRSKLSRGVMFEALLLVWRLRRRAAFRTLLPTPG